MCSRIGCGIVPASGIAGTSDGPIIVEEGVDGLRGKACYNDCGFGIRYHHNPKVAGFFLVVLYVRS